MRKHISFLIAGLGLFASTTVYSSPSQKPEPFVVKIAPLPIEPVQYIDLRTVVHIPAETFYFPEHQVWPRPQNERVTPQCFDFTYKIPYKSRGSC